MSSHEPLIWRLTRGEWDRDEAHRRKCRPGGVGCDDVAHHYGLAIEQGRVLVDGVPPPQP